MKILWLCDVCWSVGGIDDDDDDGGFIYLIVFIFWVFRFGYFRPKIFLTLFVCWLIGVFW